MTKDQTRTRLEAAKLTEDYWEWALRYVAAARVFPLVGLKGEYPSFGSIVSVAPVHQPERKGIMNKGCVGRFLWWDVLGDRVAYVLVGTNVVRGLAPTEVVDWSSAGVSVKDISNDGTWARMRSPTGELLWHNNETGESRGLTQRSFSSATLTCPHREKHLNSQKKKKRGPTITSLRDQTRKPLIVGWPKE